MDEPLETAVIYDCEYLAIEGSQRRFWCGPHDPDPVAVQIGAVRIALDGEFALSESFSVLVKPMDRQGRPYPIDPFFTSLTGITADAIDKNGLTLKEALEQFGRFSQGDRMFSWGKDEFNLIAISAYVAGIAPPIPAARFGNACDLLLAAGMPYDVLITTRSSTLPACFGIDHPPLKAHDATDDARAVAYTLQHLLRCGKLSADMLKAA